MFAFATPLVTLNIAPVLTLPSPFSDLYIAVFDIT